MLRAVRTVAAIIFAILIVPVVGQFAIQLASEQGWYDHVSAKSALILSAIAWLASQEWFLLVLCAWGGLTIGLWLASLLRKADRRNKSLPVEDDSQTLAEMGASCIKMSRRIVRDMGRESDRRKLFYRLRPELTSLALRLVGKSIRFEFQSLNYKDDFEWVLTFMGNYLAEIGPQLRDGHLNHTRRTANAFFDQSWITRPISETPPLASPNAIDPELPE